MKDEAFSKKANSLDAIRISMINLAKDLPEEEPMRQGIAATIIQMFDRMHLLTAEVMSRLSTPQMTHYARRRLQFSLSMQTKQII